MNKQVNSHFGLATTEMLPKFNTEACSTHIGQREGQKQTLRNTIVNSPLFLVSSPLMTKTQKTKTCIVSYSLRYSSVKPEFEQKDGINCTKLYIATRVLNRKSPMLVLSLFDSSLSKVEASVTVEARKYLE